MTFCQFLPSDRPRHYRCHTCGSEIGPVSDPPERCYRVCRSATTRPLVEVISETAGPPMPNFPRRLGRYVRAIARWVAKGRPTRSKELVAFILETHCHQCPLFNHEHQACSPCGCSVNSQTQALWNKLAMATEECPRRYWRKNITLPG